MNLKEIRMKNIKKKKKVLVVNEALSDNLGDRAIGLTLKWILERNNCNVVVAGYSKINYRIRKNDKARKKFVADSAVHFIKKTMFKLLWLIMIRENIKEYALNRYDIVIIGGGQLILSNFYFPIAMYLWTKYLYNNNNRNVYLVGVGCGNKFTIVDKLLYGKAFSKIKAIYVRDKDSVISLLKEFNLEAKFIPDPVILIDEIYGLKAKERQDLTILGIIHYRLYRMYNMNHLSYKEYIEEWISMIESEIKKGKIVELFYTTQEDFNQSLILQYEYYKKYKKLLKINNCDHLKEFILLLQSCSKIISGRAHALIMAKVYNKEVVPFFVSHKIKSIAKEYIEPSMAINEYKNIIKEKICEIIN